MDKEIQALNDNQTWDLVDLPPNKKPIGNKWVYKIKLKAYGSLERCKARLLAKGYNQRHGVDYEETFSPVVKMTLLDAFSLLLLVNIGLFINWTSTMLFCMVTSMKRCI